MKTKSLVLFVFLLMLSFSMPSCKKSDDSPKLKVGLVTSLGDLKDGSFNEQAIAGMKAAAEAVPIEWEVKQSIDPSEIAGNIKYFTDKNFDVIITLGYNAAEATLAAATSNPETKFIILDYSYETIPANVVCTAYKVDQAAFPCGFLAAYQACQRNPVNPAVGYVGGPDVPVIQQLTVGFSNGVEYFNTIYHKSVQISGANASNFTDTVQGAHLADSLIQRGIEVLFVCAGKTGNGALYKIKETSKIAIGVDADQFYTIPQVGPYLLTSCLKRQDASILSEIRSIHNGQFHGGQILYCELANSGVDIAPYHNFETLIPDSIKQEVVNIKTGVINGTISTGWLK